MRASSLDPPVVTLWWSSVREAVPELVSLRRLLDQTEIRRADRLISQDARARFVAAHGLLRIVLGRCLGIGAIDIRFRKGPRGKPLLAHPPACSTLHFNLSHSGDAVVVAVADSELGADVEATRPMSRAENLAARFFSEQERRQLAERQPEHREAAFLAIWTAKESYLKAVGSGVAMPLSKVEIDLSGPAFSRIIGDPHEAARWTLLQTELPIGALCSVAIRGPGWRLDVREFDWNQLKVEG